MTKFEHGVTVGPPTERDVLEDPKQSEHYTPEQIEAARAMTEVIRRALSMAPEGRRRLQRTIEIIAGKVPDRQLDKGEHDE